MLTDQTTISNGTGPKVPARVGHLPKEEASTLFPYQEEGVLFLDSKKYDADSKKFGLLCDEMGLGKSAQAIRACDRAEAKRILVLCPASVRTNWTREFSRFSITPRDTVTLLKSTDQPLRVGVTVCSYDLSVRRDVAGKLLKDQWDVVILDEAHYLKNRTAKRTAVVYGEKCDGVGGLSSRTAQLFALTGTPCPNNPAEIWPHLRAWAPGVLKKLGAVSYFAFLNRFCITRETTYGTQIVGTRNLPELKEALKGVFLRRTKGDADLPPIRFGDLTVDGLDDADSIEATPAGDAVRAWAADPDNAALLQSPAVSTLHRAYGLMKAPAISAVLLEELENGLEKIVVFAWHKEVIDQIANALAAAEIGVVTLTGSTPAEARQWAIDSFQTDPSTRVFVGQIKAAGTGITLTAASDALFAEMSWTPSDNAQAAKRIHRIGQTKPVLVRFAQLAGSLDEAITAVLRRKTASLTQLFN